MKFVMSFPLLLVLALSINAQAQRDDGKATVQATRDLIPLLTYHYSGGPSYKLKVHNDGSLVYEGIADVKTKGKVATTVTRQQLHDLLRAFDKVRFFQLQNSYNFSSAGCTSVASEGPWVTLTLRRKGRVKTVRHDLGCLSGTKKFETELKVLTDLEKEIYRILNVEQWIGTEDERKKLPDARVIPHKPS